MPADAPSAELVAWLTLLRAPGIGPARLRTLLERCGSARAVLESEREWSRLELPAEAIAWCRAPDTARLQQDVEWLAQPSHHLLTCSDPDFPTLLARTPHAPAALFIAGDPNLLWRPQIAIVGSRNPSAGGCDNAYEFARALARSGLTITSGLAEGIDAAAHRAALDTGGEAATIAVVGTGPDRVYPARNRELYARIVAHGAVVSEFPPGTEARRDHFPRRNRIIAGLGLGTLVIEASLASGSLITARQAAEAGREVFALPGSIHNPMARGCHRLIRDGAALVETAQEIVEALTPHAAQLASALRGRLALETDVAVDTHRPAPRQDPDYDALWRALDHAPVGIDVLAQRSGLTVDALSSMLLLMELDGRVSAAHGRYARRGS